MKRFIIFTIIALLLISLQEAFFSRLSFYGIYIDLILVFIVGTALSIDEIEAFFVALTVGIIKDSLFPNIFGVNSILYIILAYTLTRIQNKIYKDKTIVLMAFILISTFIKYVVYFVCFYIASIKFEFISMLKESFLIETIFNIIIAVIMIKGIKEVYNSSFMQKEWRI